MKREELEIIMNSWLDTSLEITGRSILDFLDKQGLELYLSDENDPRIIKGEIETCCGGRCHE